MKRIAIYRPEGMYQPRKVQDILGNLYLEPKYDGRWARLDTQGVCPVMHGHEESDTHGGFTYLPSRLAEFCAHGLRIAKNSIVEGELIWVGHAAAEISTAIVKCPQELIFKPFAVPLWENQDLTTSLYLEARALLQGTSVAQCLPLFINIAAPFPDVPGLLKLHQKYWPSAEGLVVKRYWYARWWKAKPVRTADLVVRGFTIGTTGKWKNLPNALLLSTGSGRDAGHCGNMKDADRMDIPNHVGKVVEVAFDCITVDHKLRFPRFVRWRDDKRPSACQELKDQL